ncbi:unnamed protein product [Rotaria socialis]|uniref:Uncharacterized protein n=1 Tax=Rotaria socialis TaxID=392032 RepID=A0A821RUH1_9BILA|nr:unnamed protein product [Rotaria socialis]
MNPISLCNNAESRQESTFDECTQSGNNNPFLDDKKSTTCQSNTCDKDSGKCSEVQPSCSYFRKMVERITSITDPRILDEIENLHIQCKNCEVKECDKNYCTKQEETQHPNELCTDQRMKANPSQIQFDKSCRERAFESKEDMTTKGTQISIPSMHPMNLNENVERLIAESEPHARIDLRHQQLTDQHMHTVAKLAIVEKQCEILDLGSNRITPEGIFNIGEAVSRSTSILRLYLGGNQLFDDGVRFLAPLVQNSCLFVLGLANNNITDQGAFRMAQMLENNQRLTVLGLEENQIGDNGVQMLADVLKDKNVHLKHLLLANNAKITDSSVESLIKMLQCNKSLNRLDLRYCSLSTTAKDKLQKVEKWRKIGVIQV